MKEPNIRRRRRTQELDEFGKVLGTLGELLSVSYIYAYLKKQKTERGVT